MQSPKKNSNKHPLSSSLPNLQRMNSHRMDLFGKGITHIDNKIKNEPLDNIR